ncbi:MAG: ABC transporter ATP-binding protein [Armatimonadota bacterium]
MADSVVVAEGLKKTYGGAVPLEVLHGIDLVIAESELVSIGGQSGSGKSTLLNILGALDRPTQGTVQVAGLDLNTATDDELADLRNNAVGFIFQFHYLLAEFTCLENALMPVAIEKGEPAAEDVERVTEMLTRVGLGERLHNRPSMLSGGEQQRTAIVRALANQPRLVLADEPTGNLDARTTEDVFELLLQMNEETGVAFIIVTHDDSLARRASRFLRIEDGYLRDVSDEEL